ncbi:hypothetical protein ABEB36_008796 [Hypothenemus hampei]|uniref:Uncharacterized protein n=1 Tax=Hypothenemus hampei TaxID=57062 RepID=A0ABD1EN38_HYPHA
MPYFVKTLVSVDIKVYNIEKCNSNAPYPASLTVEKRMPLNIWLPIPCIDQLGSCTYRDLCSYGTPVNRNCPDRFVRNNVPCRCPILEGRYEIKPDNQIRLFKVPNKIFLIDPNGTVRYENVKDGTYRVKTIVVEERV